MSPPGHHPSDSATPLAGGLDGAGALAPLLETALTALRSGAEDRSGPVPALSPASITASLRAATGGDLLPAEGAGAHETLRRLGRAFAAGAADPADPACAAHLHCPPLAVAVAADLMASALNPSLDSWDQAPSGTQLETEVIAALARLVGYGTRAAGVVTTGGTESNVMGLLLARDDVLRRRAGVRASQAGLGAAGPGRLRILTSQAAHFSVARGAGLLGIGEDAVLPVATDTAHRMSVPALERALRACAAAGEIPVAVVATAGTTDLGAVDPLRGIAEVCAAAAVRLHVDASYGGGALFSDRLAPLLDGLEQADSVALDLHKLGWQPVPAGVFLSRDTDLFAPLERSVVYLNADDDTAAGHPSLLGRSLRTTRRPDVLKIAVTLRALGRDGLGRLVDRCHELAEHAAARIAAHPRLELYAAPVLSTVVFRYRPAEPAAHDPDAVNAELRRVLLAEGRAVVGRTEADGAVRLKLTLLNPHARTADVDALLDAVVDVGDKETR